MNYCHCSLGYSCTCKLHVENPSKGYWILLHLLTLYGKTHTLIFSLSSCVFVFSVSDRYKQRQNSKSSTSGTLICCSDCSSLDIYFDRLLSGIVARAAIIDLALTLCYFSQAEKCPWCFESEPRLL